MTLLQLLYGTWQHVVDCFKSAQRRALFDGMFRYCYETLGFLHPDSLYGRPRDNVVVPRRTHWQGPPSPPPDSISRGKKKALLIGINYKLSPEHHDFGGLDGPHEDVDKMAEFLEGMHLLFIFSNCAPTFRKQNMDSMILSSWRIPQKQVLLLPLGTILYVIPFLFG